MQAGKWNAFGLNCVLSKGSLSSLYKKVEEAQGLETLNNQSINSTQISSSASL